MSNAQFSQWRERVAAARVLIVGDVMLDRYWFGDVERISPEAPVPVVKIARTRGAARRRRQRRAQRRGAGRAGDAAVGHRRRTSRRTPCCACSTRTAIETSFLRDAALTTTVKLRVIGRQQQLLRIDFETAPPHELLAAQPRRIRRAARRRGRARAVRLRQGRARAHRDDDRSRPRGRQAGAGRSEGRRLGPLSRRHGDHAESQRVPAGRGPLRATKRISRNARRRCDVELDLERAARHALGGGNEPLLRRGRADDSRAGARSVRRVRARAIR